jgi:hypothetical protein
MVMLTGWLLLTIIVIELLVAGLFKVQGKLDVNTHVITSPFIGVYVKV